MKGIILAGGNGTRLLPITKYVNKHLIPVYDKPMIYYPMSTLLKMGINEILIITNSKDKKNFYNLLGDGKLLGCDFKYLGQNSPSGTGAAVRNATQFIGREKVAVILGDNIYSDFNYNSAVTFSNSKQGALVYAKKVEDPHRYGVVELGLDNKPLSIEEKPKYPKSNFAITGLYLFDEMLLPFSKRLSISERGEYEITDILKDYLLNDSLAIEIINDDCLWGDSGTFASLSNTANLIEELDIYNRPGYIEEVAFQKGLISRRHLKYLAEKLAPSEYGQYLLNKYT